MHETYFTFLLSKSSSSNSKSYLMRIIIMEGEKPHFQVQVLKLQCKDKLQKVGGDYHTAGKPAGMI